MGITVSNYKPLTKPNLKALPKTIAARVEKFWKLYHPVMSAYLKNRPLDSSKLKAAVADAKKCQSLFWNIKHRSEKYESKEFVEALSLAWQHAWELEDKARLMQADDVTYKPKHCKQGDKGSVVKGYQALLKDWRFYRKKVDGKFGDGTLEAVEKFQKKSGLKVDGKIGSKTAAKVIEYAQKFGNRASMLQAIC